MQIDEPLSYFPPKKGLMMIENKETGNFLLFLDGVEVTGVRKLIIEAVYDDVTTITLEKIVT